MRFVVAVVVMSLVVAAVAVGFAAAAFVVAPPRTKGDEAEDMVEASGLYRTTSSLHGALNSTRKGLDETGNGDTRVLLLRMVS